MKKLAIIPLFLALASCNSVAPNSTVVVTKTQFQVVVPDESMYNCPLYKQFPNARTLTDIQVAKTIVSLYKNNVKCKNSLEAIHKFINDSKSTVNN